MNRVDLALKYRELLETNAQLAADLGALLNDYDTIVEDLLGFIDDMPGRRNDVLHVETRRAIARVMKTCVYVEEA